MKERIQKKVYFWSWFWLGIALLRNEQAARIALFPASNFSHSSGGPDMPYLAKA